MPTSTLTKFEPYVENLAEAKFNFTSDATCTLTLALSNAANAPLTTYGQLSQLTTIAYTFLSARVLSVSSSSQTAGLYKLLITSPFVLSASGGDAAAFRYISVYDDDSASDYLIGYWDYGSDLTLHDGESLTFTFGANGLLTIQ
jgi:hypothetical protein